MAPTKGKETLLELCASSTTLGNIIAVHVLEYLSVAKAPPDGFNRLAVEFLETSRVLLPTKAGLAVAERARTQFLADITKELRERLRQAFTALTVLNQVVNRFLDNERKQGFSKLGKGFRMRFADSEVDKLRQSLAQCREALVRIPVVLAWTASEAQEEAAAGIGYTALAAVLDLPDPTGSTRGRQPSSASDTLHRKASYAAPSHESPRPAAAPLQDRYASASRREMHHADLPESVVSEHERYFRPAASTENSDMSAARALSYRSSTMPTPGSMTTIASPTATTTDIEEMMQVHDLDDKAPKQAVRITIDPTKVARWTPKRRGAVSPESRMALLVAVQQKNQKMVEQLLECGVPAESGPEERNLLRVAITNYDLANLRLLLLFGADANAQDRDGLTPLYTATESSFFEAAQLLLQYGADPNVSAGPYEEKWNPFALSLTNGKAHFAHLYLKHGADTDAIMENGNTPFVQAMNKTTAINFVELMLLYSADPDCKNGRGETALFRAIEAKRIDLVRILIEHGANPNLPGPKHMLWPAVHQPRILGVLLDQGADLQRAPGVLELATSINSLEAVNILLKHGVDVNAKKDGIYTPLCTAIRDNRGHLVDILLAAGADPNLPASEYPAFKCVTHHRAHLLPRLLAAGADPSSPRGIIETAVAHNDEESLLILLKHKVDPNARNSASHTALTTAIRMHRLELMDTLLAHGANPGVRGQDWPISMAVKSPEILAKLLPHIQASRINKGALELAVVADQLESVQLLLAKGVDVEEKNGGVFSPLTTSIREDRKAIFQYLIDEAGADPNAPGEHLPIIKAIRRHREHDLSYIEHLLAKGADINLMYRGWNAVLQALDNGDLEILKLLAHLGNPDLGARDEVGKSVLEILEERGLKEEEQILLGGRSPSPRMQEALSSLRSFVRQ
ncbi:hypothetical protein LTR36_007795 [Oleoguttula mirabilis]|uniref:Ankyrin repeat protein n=1 Tax=Oleoguttula mirabilis TaxID=1507867 RepID=A0AAV9J966_9PEZI|nr:hypothetical protein LTR36_007795 [Oleoguttula mirabilis]